jgi:hypothetical protein
LCGFMCCVSCVCVFVCVAEYAYAYVESESERKERKRHTQKPFNPLTKQIHNIKR